MLPWAVPWSMPRDTSAREYTWLKEAKHGLSLPLTWLPLISAGFSRSISAEMGRPAARSLSPCLKNSSCSRCTWSLCRWVGCARWPKSAALIAICAHATAMRASASTLAPCCDVDMVQEQAAQWTLGWQLCEKAMTRTKQVTCALSLRKTCGAPPLARHVQESASAHFAFGATKAPCQAPQNPANVSVAWESCTWPCKHLSCQQALLGGERLLTVGQAAGTGSCRRIVASSTCPLHTA